ncbi:MAG: hypothetical protein ACW98Y_10685 [Candidatus Thorarchaeota archaeon]
MSVHQPPNIDDVLLDDEKVEWSGKERIHIKYFCAPFTIVFVLLPIIMSPIPFDSPIAIVGYLYSIIVVFVSLYYTLLYPKWYRITNQRLLEMRRSRILKEVSLGRFGDRSLGESITMRLDHHASDRGSSPVYDITFYDAETAEPLIMFNDLWWPYTDKMDFIPDLQACPSCGLWVSKEIEKCLACGQSLV